MADADQSFADRMKASATGCFQFLYDKQTGKVMGRTGKSWALITVFYIIYYILLACFFGGMINVFLFTVIKDDQPYRTGEDSLLFMNPGLGFIPQPKVETTLIKYTVGDKKSYQHYIDIFEKEIASNVNIKQKYQNNTRSYVGCNNKNPTPSGDPKTKLCLFELANYVNNTTCNALTDYGFKTGLSCVFLKLNRIYGWIPDVIDKTNPHVLVKCDGENPADRENIGQPEYYPNIKVKNSDNVTETYGYFSNAYFPYLNQEGYTRPYIVTWFNNARKNVLIMVVCRIYNLKNSKFDKMDKEAMARFEILALTK